MTPRYYVHNPHYHLNTGIVLGMMTLDTNMRKDQIVDYLRENVTEHLSSGNLFYLPGSMRMQNPYHFIDGHGNFLEPIVETEAEYEERMNRGIRLIVPVTA